MHKTTDEFWKCFNKLPKIVQERAKKQFELLKENSSHPSLHFKKLGKFWSVRISDFYRALAIKDEDDYIWVWIGTHDDYEKMIKRKP
jgi:mRNA-degrading endonuclease RelE of RelBE toxin-antitoxin system